MHNPVMLVESGHTYEMSAIVKYLEQGHRICPVSKMQLLNCNLVSNLTMKNCVDDWVSETGGVIVGPAVGKDDEAFEFDWISALLEAQLKGTYKGWDDQDSMSLDSGTVYSHHMCVISGTTMKMSDDLKHAPCSFGVEWFSANLCARIHQDCFGLCM